MERISDIKRPKTDKRQYRYIELPNALRCMLISDPEIEESAASLNVQVGSLNGPRDVPGLAHFCEHMLFLGTKKYPDESSYGQFIKLHGGNKNAYTDLVDTNYYFTVVNSAFPEALDRFSQFFKEPLFNAESVAREINAVDSEHKKNLPSDQRRLHQLLSSQANPESRVNVFMTGSAETLTRENIRDRLIDFYDKEYSANLMTLALLGKDPLDRLEELCKENFSSIVNKNLTVLDTTLPIAYDESRLGKFYKVLPIGHSHKLYMMWKFPDTRKLYKTMPSLYCSHLLGHEGTNSLLSYLIDEELAHSVVSYTNPKEANTAFMSIEIELTDKGLNEYERIIAIVSAYVSVLREKGPQKYFFEEVIQLGKLQFDFREKGFPTNTVIGMAKAIHKYSKENIRDIMEGQIAPTEYDPDAIKLLLDLLIPENLIIALSSKVCQDEVKLEEKWYKTKYCLEDFSPSLKKALFEPKVGPSASGKVLDLPPPNLLIAKNVDLAERDPSPSEFPRKVRSAAGSCVWFKQDHKFNVPKGYGFCAISTNDNGFPVMPESSCFFVLYSKVFFEDIREFMYMARLAGIFCKFKIKDSHLTLQFHGYNESLPLLVRSFLEKLKKFDSTKSEKVFNIKLKNCVEKIMSSLKQTPYLLSAKDYMVGLRSFGIDSSQLLEIFKAFTFEKFIYYTNNWLKNTHLKWYIAGNLTEKQAIEIADSGDKFLLGNPMPRELTTDPRMVCIPEKTEYVLSVKSANASEVNSCLISYFQGSSYSYLDTKSIVLNFLAFDLINESCFAYLRTKLQLGYVVTVNSNNTGFVLGGRFLIQSDKMTPEEVYQKINEFIGMAWEEVKNLSDKIYKFKVEGLCASLREKHASLMMESLEYWKEIVTRTYLFDRRQKMIEVLGSLKKEEVIAHFESILIKNIRRYDYEMVCSNHWEQNESTKLANIRDAESKGCRRIEVRSYDEMRAVNTLYPDFYYSLPN